MAKSRFSSYLEQLIIYGDKYVSTVATIPFVDAEYVFSRRINRRIQYEIGRNIGFRGCIRLEYLMRALITVNRLAFHSGSSVRQLSIRIIITIIINGIIREYFIAQGFHENRTVIQNLPLPLIFIITMNFFTTF